MNFAKNKKELNKSITEHIGNNVAFDEKKEWEVLGKLKKHPFFKLLNIVLNVDQKGKVLGLGLPVIASTTDTRLADREAVKNYNASDDQTYFCEQVNFDSIVPDDRLDTLSGAVDVDFNTVLAEETDRAVLLSLFAMGFNGVARTKASTSQSQQFPLAQDVKKGWLQKIREQNEPKLITRPTVGKGQQFANLNKLIAHALEKLPEVYRHNRNELVAICGANLIADYPVAYAELADRTPGKVTQVQKLIGGLNAVGLPYFPENSVLILPLANLSLYFQKGTFRRFVSYVSAKNRSELYFSMNLDFIVEDYQAAVLIDNVEMVEE